MQKIIKRVMFVVLSAAILMFCLVSCNDKKETTDEKPTYLFLGDSIAEALLGPSPITERDSYGYYSIVGQINDARYVNRAISGLTSIGFVNSLCNRKYYEEEDAFYREYWIQNADVIFISMLGNDVLCNDMIEFAIETGKATTQAGVPTLSADYQSKIDRRCIPNLNEGMARIYELNPDATVIWQTLYNPFFDDSVLIDQEDWDWYNEEVAKGTIDEKYSFRDLADILVDAVNQLVYDYQKQNPDKKFYVSDVNGAFEKVFESDEREGQKLVFSDCIHPSIQGHALIAETLEKTLCDLGLSSMESAASKYKDLVAERAQRLYNDQNVVSSVRSANDFSAVTTAYFSATACLSPDCKTNVAPYPNGNYFETDVSYDLESLRLDEMELTTLRFDEMEFDENDAIAQAILLLFPDGIDIMDRVLSYLDFYDDGTFEMAFTLNGDCVEMANTLLGYAGIDKIDVVDFYLNEPFCSYNTTYDMYFREIFPGFDLTELKKSIELLSSVGCTVTGVDTESEEFRKVAQSLKENGTLPEDFTIPEGFGFKLNGYYTVETLGEGENARKVAYLRLVRTGEDTVPMFCVLIDGNGEEGSALLKIEFCSLRILFRDSQTDR